MKRKITESDIKIIGNRAARAAALRASNSRLRSTWAIKRLNSQKGSFPLSLADAETQCKKIGYKKNWKSWNKAVSTLTNIEPAHLTQLYQEQAEAALEDKHKTDEIDIDAIIAAELSD